MWPIFWHTHDLPPTERFQLKNVRLCGIWFGKKKPHMNLFFQPFHSELQRYYEKGFEITVNGKKELSRGVAITGAVDSPAKSDLKNMAHHNGNCGCPYCLHPGKHVSSQENQKKKGSVHSYNPAENYPDRTTSSCITHAQKASQTGEPCYGIKGPSLLLLLSVFNFVFGLPVDYMHCICLGVSKKLTSLWFDSKYSAYPWYLGKHLQEIDRLLLAITPPKFIKRTPRSLTERQHWKASGYRSWLLYYAPVVLKGYLPPLYFHHFLLLVHAVLVMTSNRITRVDLDKADVELKFFLEIFQKIYGLRFVTLNFHLLRHLAKCVRKYGPLWTVSCFPFENANGWLVRCITGTHNVFINMVNSALALSNIRKVYDVVLHPGCAALVREYLGKTSYENCFDLKHFGQNIALSEPQQR